MFACRYRSDPYGRYDRGYDRYDRGYRGYDRPPPRGYDRGYGATPQRFLAAPKQCRCLCTPSLVDFCSTSREGAQVRTSVVVAMHVGHTQ